MEDVICYLLFQTHLFTDLHALNPVKAQKKEIENRVQRVQRVRNNTAVLGGWVLPEVFLLSGRS